MVFSGVLLRSRSRRQKSAYDLMEIENWSRKRSHNLDGIGDGRIRTFSFSVAYGSSENLDSGIESEAK